MVKQSSSQTSVAVTEQTHKCSSSCLGPLTFHNRAVGDMVRLSQGCRLAERNDTTFKNGLVFSSRPLKAQEKVRLRVERDSHRWQGTVRLGFTNVPPSARSLPLPCLAIPDLSDSPGHWMAPVHESYCQPGSVLEFWVSGGGSVYVTNDRSRRQKKLLSGVDLSKPLWAVIDIYGQTCSVFLLGSEKKALISTSRSCPAPEPLTSSDIDNIHSWISTVSKLCEDSEDRVSDLDRDVTADKHWGLKRMIGMRKLLVHFSVPSIDIFRDEFHFY
uniref:Neuralized E3 ubiquitin protein ligase 3 n=1 Tax=Cynoglossus semilaevis TaxID=244447 RepID=A0A3P8VVV4_CYNSE